MALSRIEEEVSFGLVIHLLQQLFMTSVVINDLNLTQVGFAVSFAKLSHGLYVEQIAVFGDQSDWFQF